MHGVLGLSVTDISEVIWVIELLCQKCGRRVLAGMIGFVIK
jgi:uncharacterized radical SAM superfamily protein